MNVQPIEGITPEGLWTAVQVALGLAAIALVIFKLVEFNWKVKDRKQTNRLNEGSGVTDEIANKVMEKLAPRLDEIDKKLARDYERLNAHEMRLSEQEKGLHRITKDTAQIMDVLDGMLMHFITGNGQDHLKDVKNDLDRYKNSR